MGVQLTMKQLNSHQFNEASEQLIRKKTAQRNQLEEDFLKARKAENECQESTTKN